MHDLIRTIGRFGGRSVFVLAVAAVSAFISLGRSKFSSVSACSARAAVAAMSASFSFCTHRQSAAADTDICSVAKVDACSNRFTANAAFGAFAAVQRRIRIAVNALASLMLKDTARGHGFAVGFAALSFNQGIICNLDHGIADLSTVNPVHGSQAAGLAKRALFHSIAGRGAHAVLALDCFHAHATNGQRFAAHIAKSGPLIIVKVLMILRRKNTGARFIISVIADLTTGIVFIIFPGNRRRS